MREAAGVRLVWLCSPNNPTGEQLDAALVERICAACPGIVVLDQAYLELGGEDLSRPRRRATRTSSSRARSRRASRSAPHASATASRSRPWPRRSTRCGRPARSRRGRPPSPSWPATRRDELQERCAAIVEERGWLAAGHAPRGRRGAGARRQLRARALARARRLRAPRRARLRRAHVRARAAAGRLLPRHRLAPRRQRAAARARSPSSRAARRRRPTDGVRGDRVGEVRRATRETRIEVRLGLLGGGRARVATGLGFLDHMLTSLAFWSLTDLDLRCSGDLWVDEHHTVEDCAIALGEALDMALGDRAGVRRFGSARAPLDEALAEATVDLSGRGIAELDLALGAPAIGRMPSSARPPLLRQLRPPRRGSACTSARPARTRTTSPRRPSRRSRWRCARRSSPTPRAAASRARRACCDRHDGRLRSRQPALAAGGLRARRRRGRGQRRARAGRARRARDHPRRRSGRRGHGGAARARPRRRDPGRACAAARTCSACASGCSCCSRAARRATRPGSACCRAARRSSPARAACRTWAGTTSSPRRRTRSPPPSPHRATSRTPTPCRTPRRAACWRRRRSSTARFASLVGEGRVAGAQFHPERSGAAGAEFLRAVMRWAGDAA